MVEESEEVVVGGVVFLFLHLPDEIEVVVLKIVLSMIATFSFRSRVERQSFAELMRWTRENFSFRLKMSLA
jgi:hypothetical protein